MSSEYTEDQVRAKFLEAVQANITYWAEQPMPNETLRDRLESLAFSILVIIDGEHALMPSFILAPTPHPEDKQYRIDRGEDYYPENDENDVECDIGGSLHDTLGDFSPKKS